MTPLNLPALFFSLSSSSSSPTLRLIANTSMPQVDLETLVCGDDSRLACETLSSHGAPSPQSAPAEDDLYPPSSVSFEAPVGWSGSSLGYRVYGREESTKGITNPKSSSNQANPKSRSSSDRFPAAAANPPSSKPPIIGLPAKIQTSRYDGRCIRRPTQGRIFPKKGSRRGGKKPAVPESEPGSPKVSFFGKILSDSERARRRREQRRGSAGERESLGCWARFAGFFRCGDSGSGVTEAALQVRGSGISSSSPPSESVREKTARKSWAVETQPAAEMGPGLGGLKRFSSGRRAASWGEEAELKGRRSVS
ncbi:hypothetical protein Cni_G24826 [Canna indica]|uniref:Uncharacterized protein n=1 Tax=Canna indica TaxID=4628 RepID=A0AAQ3KWH0_9LILI|nr:hypothetical protein Cni_G24826 [Canna indica]